MLTSKGKMLKNRATNDSEDQNNRDLLRQIITNVPPYHFLNLVLAAMPSAKLSHLFCNC